MVEVNARDIQAVEKAVKEEIAKDEVSRSLRRHHVYFWTNQRNRYIRRIQINVRSVVCA